MTVQAIQKHFSHQGVWVNFEGLLKVLSLLLKSVVCGGQPQPYTWIPRLDLSRQTQVPDAFFESPRARRNDAASKKLVHVVDHG